MDNFISIESFYEQYFKNLKEGDLLLDVRTEAEFDESRLENSYNMTHTEVLNAASKVNESERVFIYCRRGARAQNAYQQLTDSGISSEKFIVISDGGMERWINNSWPLA